MKEKVQAPELRFDGFTDDWEERKLGDIAPLRGGFAFKSSKFRNTGVPIVRISNILSSGEVGGDFAYYDEQDKDDKYILPDKSAVLAMSGATTGKVSILSQTDYDKVYQNQRVGYFQSVDYIDYGFISTIVRSELFMMQLESVLVSGAQPNVSSKEIDSFNFMIPILVQEQQIIGSFFKQLDETIALHQRKLDLLKEQKKGYLQKMFPKNGDKVPELRFAGFSDDWELRKLGDISKVIDPHPSHRAPAATEEGIPFIGIGDVNEVGNINYKTARIVDAKIFDEHHNRYDLSIPSIGIGRVASLGKVIRLRDDIGKYVVSPTMSVIQFTNNNDLDFLYSNMNTPIFQKQFKSFSNGSTRQSVGIQDLRILMVSLPVDIEEQQKIGSFFNRLDNTIALHQRKLDLLKEQKKGFLQKMFV
jgi:type I restriction enzyme, S subunit